MGKGRKLLSLFMSLLLFLGLLSNVLASDNSVKKLSIKNGQIQSSITEQENLRKDKKNSQDYRNPGYGL